MPPLARTVGFIALPLALLAACGVDDGIPNASVENIVDSAVTLTSLSTGPLQAATAYSLDRRAGVRTWDIGADYEFVYSTDSAGRHFFLPLDVLGLAGSSSLKPGLKPSAVDFDLLKVGSRNGYTTSDSIEVAVGQTWYLRTGINTCAALSVPRYGKLKVLSFDTVAHTVTFQVLVNQNCGYRELTEGLPTH